jgi:hypothetical protein
VSCRDVSLLDNHYRCKMCGAQIAYAPDRPEEDWEPFLLCRSCIGMGEQLIKACAHALRSYMYGNSSPELARMVVDSCDAALMAVNK